MSVAWPSAVNTDFYGMTRTSEENVITTEFESGKKRYTLKNSTPKLVFSVMLDFKTKTEERAFWEWYSDELLSRTETVILPDFLGSDEEKEYRMTEEPSVEGLLPKVATFTFMEE